ncbi:MAG TPA: hypothetical protein VK789_23555 [Bryobacteraceae bacterium]|jgi:hypothetical protein|nr:hypothetical protein [Bryobacteraceae bacterium]
MFYVGLDLGQRRDHTAIAVLERKERVPAYGPSVFERLLVRHLERLPLGTPYTSVVSVVQSIVQDQELRGRCVLVVDGTGVGAPVVDALRAARLNCEVCAVTITSGDREHQQGAAWNVPKKDLIAGVQVLLERGELSIAGKLAEAGSLVRELLNMRITLVGNGRVRLGADGLGEHDDLVIAVALACWRARRRQNGVGTQRLTGI